jgi:Tfp pilus assembly protein PilO
MTSALRKVVFFILLVGVACVAYQFMIKPANKHLAEQKARVDEKVARLAEFERATTAAEDLSKQVEMLQQAVAFFESKLPPTSEIDKVLRDVSVIGEKQGLKPKTIRTLMVGNFNSFYAFLLELEKLPRIMKIRELKLQKEDRSEGGVKTDFVISIFFQNTIS